MKFQRRQFLHLAATATAVPALSRIATAQTTYPSRPITMIVPLAAGGPLDAVARVIAEQMRRSLGQPIIIENVTGADGGIATSRVARARPDGYTIEFGFQGPNVLNGAFYSLPYNVLDDLAPISLLATAPVVLYAKKTMSGNDLRELIAWLKANPNKASHGFYSAVDHLLIAFFQKETGTQTTLVPYRGLAPAMQDLVAGNIDLLNGSPASLPLMRAGNIKAYAVTSDRRLALAPDIPTYAEMGLPTLSFSTWFGLFAPKGTPTGIITKLNKATEEALAETPVRSRLVDFGYEVFPREKQTPEALSALRKGDVEIVAQGRSARGGSV